MTIKEIMEIGTDGMNTAEKMAEQDRRLKVVEKINRIGLMISNADKQKRVKLNREIKKLKASESVWLKQAAWFMYA